MNKVVMYSKDYCPYCARAKALLEQRGVTDLEIIQIDRDPSQRDVMIERTGRRTVPQIFIGDTHVGGCDGTCSTPERDEPPPGREPHAQPPPGAR